MVLTLTGGRQASRTIQQVVEILRTPLETLENLNNLDNLMEFQDGY